MSIEQPDVVDGLGLDKATGVVVLTISDHLTWGEYHLAALEAKLASYINFIESGQLVASLPSAAERKVEIHLVCQHRPSPDAETFLAAARASVNERGLGFTFGPLPSEGYSGDHG